MRLRRSFVHASLLVAVLVAAGSPALADYKEHYRNGIRAMNHKEWERAIDQLRKAIAEHPTAGGDSIRDTGMFSEEYMPYFRLCLAYHQVGRAWDAKVALEQSKKQGVIGPKELRKLNVVYQQVKNATDPTKADSKLVKLAQAEVKKADDHESALRQKRKDPDFGSLPKELQDGLNELLRNHSGITARLASAKTDGDLESVAQDARKLNKDFTTASKKIDKGLEVIVARRIDRAVERVSGLMSVANKRGGEMTGQRDQALAQDPSLRDDWGKTGQTLNEATDLFNKGRQGRDLKQIDQAGQLFRQVASARESIITQVDLSTKAGTDEEDRLVFVANQDIARQEKEARSLVDQASALDSPGSNVLSEKAGLEKLLGHRPANGASSGELRRHAEFLEGGNGRLGSAIDSEQKRISIARAEQVESAREDDSPNLDDDLAVPIVPSAIDHRLAEAYQAYTECDYDGVETALDGATFDKAWLNVQANLFRAAAFFARYVHGGKQDDSLRERARRAVQECLRLDPDFSPREVVFAPPFLAFYRES